MSDAASQVQADLPPIEPNPPAVAAVPASIAAPRPRPRLWPGVALVVLMLLTIWVPAWLDAPGMVRYMCVYFGPMIAALGVAVWWLFFSRVPWTDRGLSLVGVAAGAVLAYFLSLLNVPLLIVYAVPTVLTVWVLALAATWFIPWSAVRLGLPAVLLLTWAAYLCVRFDGLYGELYGTFSWRWSLTAEQKFLAEKAAIGTASGPAAMTLQPGDWVGFRGPRRDGRLTGVRIAADWNQNPPRQLWSHRVGPGWGSFAVVGDSIFTQEQRGPQESVVCYDANSGKEIWAHDDATRFEDLTKMGGDGPRATPMFHDGKIYTLGGKGRLNCLNAATGAVVWSRDIVEDSGATVPIWGFASSPLVVGDVVTVIAAGSGDKSMSAYDAASGRPRWSAAAGKQSYSSPHPAKLGGVEQVLCTTDAGVTAFDAAGAVLWKYDWPQAMHRTLQPTILDDSDVLISSLTGTRRVRIHHDKDGWKTEDVWNSPALIPNYNDMVVYDDAIYGYNADSFVCISLEDGRQKWRTKAYGSGQVLLLADQGLLLVVSEHGAVALLKATPEKREELCQFQALEGQAAEGKTWNHPVVAHGKLFVRNAAFAACYQLAPEGPPSIGK
ncbi:MAG TPA: PQQ-binding-like beta-propeller repeat protein [Gemmataceae bacterium]|nr:PQQ-binding-like beta-propeller repeat protein [Gemmataceae bacterium]